MIASTHKFTKRDCAVMLIQIILGYFAFLDVLNNNGYHYFFLYAIPAFMLNYVVAEKDDVTAQCEPLATPNSQTNFLNMGIISTRK